MLMSCPHRHRVSAEQRSGTRIRADACLSVASLRLTPSDVSSAGYRAAALTLARLLFAYFLLAMQEKVRRLPGRDPASHFNNYLSEHATMRVNS
jgi:hypothetical protein